ncbi:MAG: response regulator [Bacteroidetes bacterium]|nr:response regulator [Bacteroidota bacterium]
MEKLPHKKDIYCFLIDDDEDDRKIFEIAVNKISPDITIGYAHSGPDAIEQLKKCERIPDFIFLDLNMPIMSGAECLVELKKTASVAEVPVIIYSTTITEKIIYDTLHDGAFDHIEKPSKIDKLVQYLKRIFQLQD